MDKNEGNYINEIHKRLINPKSLGLESEPEDFSYWLQQICNVIRQVGISEEILKDSSTSKLIEDEHKEKGKYILHSSN
jgi:hypothetical protein